MNPRGRGRNSGGSYWNPRRGSSRSGGYSAGRWIPVGRNVPCNEFSEDNGEMSQGEGDTPPQLSHKGTPNHFEQKSTSRHACQPINRVPGIDGGDNGEIPCGGHVTPLQSSQRGTVNLFEQKSTHHPTYQPIKHSPGRIDGKYHNGSLQQKYICPEAVGNISKPSDLAPPEAKLGNEDLYQDVRRLQNEKTTSRGIGDGVLHLNPLGNVMASVQEESQLSNSVTKDNDYKSLTSGTGDSGSSVLFQSFDICPPKPGTTVTLKPSLLSKNREKRNDMKRSTDGQNGIILRPGMVLLRNHLSVNDQVRIVKLCRDLGKGNGGFYQPGYRDGGKLHLKMMCLGKNWDPQTSEYGHIRLVDGTKPPGIPDPFKWLVEKSIKDSHDLIGKGSDASNVRSILPWMKPNICIVNFYSESGRLGLHQDRDESQESIQKGLPVVSFSIGDTAEFLYGDEKDIDKADKVLLESGDLLIFGGESRRVFHGVSAIRPNTAPKSLLEETNLLPGRLNLTFREY